MSKVCAICGKGNLTRSNKRHTARGKAFSNTGPHGMKGKKVNYTFKPNFRGVRIEKGSPKINTCMSCYKSIRPTLAVAVAK